MGETDFLFKIPAFIDGMARNIDLFGSFDDYNGSQTPEEADAKAFSHDMAALSADSRKAFEKNIRHPTHTPYFTNLPVFTSP